MNWRTSLALVVAASLADSVFGRDQAEELRNAVRGGVVWRVKALLDGGADVNSTVENGFTPIYFAENPAIVDLLIARGAKLDLRDRARLQTPLERAAENCLRHDESRGYWQTIVSKFRAAGAEYTIDAAIFMNDIDAVKGRLDKGTSWINRRRGAQSVPLRLAARTGRVEICKLLLAHGADPNDFENGNGYPVMVDAVKHDEIVKLLLEKRPNLKRRITWRGHMTGPRRIGNEATALHFAVLSGNEKSVTLLLDAGLDANAADDEGQTPLHLAVRYWHWDELGEDRGKNEATAVKLVEVLLDHEASFMLRDRWSGKSPMAAAEAMKSSRPAVLKALRKRQEQLELEARGRGAADK